jgi:hypothetical protein
MGHFNPLEGICNLDVFYVQSKIFFQFFLNALFKKPGNFLSRHKSGESELKVEKELYKLRKFAES